MRERLPKGWVEVQLESLILLLESGNRPKGGVRGIREGIPSLGGEHLDNKGGFNFSNIKYVPLDFFYKMNKGHVKKEDILVVKDGATTGKTSFITDRFPYGKAVVNEHVFLLRCSKEISSSFLFRYLWSEEGQRKILANFQGVAQGGINRRFISNTIIPLAPFNEQKRIAAKLDHIMPKIDSVKDRLERISKIIKRFRQSVLTAAVTGKLTEKWREEHPDLESAEMLLERIKKERKRKYREECDRVKKEGKRKPRKYFNSELILRNDLELFEIPSEWKWSSLQFLMNEDETFCYGVIQPGKNDKYGIPLIRICDLENLKIKRNNLRFISKSNDLKYRRSKVKSGDLLVTVVGTIGRIAIVDEKCDSYNIARAIARVPIKDFSVNFIQFWLNTSTAQYWLVNDAREVARKTLNLEQLKTLPVPLPPLEEQQEIVRQVDKLFAFADKLEEHYKRAKEKIDRLPQSVLAKAFRGELVSQDPNDEPAEKLLERIKQEKERLKATNPGKKRNSQQRLKKAVKIRSFS